MTPTHAIILAGGTGSRMGTETPKQFLPLAGRPVILWSIETMASVSSVDRIIITIPDEHTEKMRAILKGHSIEDRITLVTGGATRQGSVYNGLTALDCDDNDIVLIHDSARPFIEKETIEECIKGAADTGAAGVYVPATDTMAEVRDGLVTAIPDRKLMYRTQTPQAFRFSLIMEAHEKARARGRAHYTDDVSLVMDSGHDVSAVTGNDTNIKITTPVDYELARIIAEGL